MIPQCPIRTSGNTVALWQRGRCAAFRLALVTTAASLAITGSVTRADTLYATDFSNFLIGADLLAGTDGWVGSNLGQGVHGTVGNTDPSIGTAGFIGRASPASTAVLVYRRTPFTPSAQNGTEVRFSTKLMLNKSTSGDDDFFNIVVYNQDSEILSSLAFNMFNKTIRRRTDSGYETLGTEFEFATLFELAFTIDFAGNTWTATMDGAPLFEDAPFAPARITLNLNEVGAAWIIYDPDNPGNNWMMFDDWRVEVRRPLRIDSVTMAPGGAVNLRWRVSPGRDYKVQSSDDGETWSDDLPQSSFSAGSGDRVFEYSDTTNGGARQRIYRVLERQPARTGPQP